MTYSVAIAFRIPTYRSRLQANGSEIIYQKDCFLKFTLGVLLLQTRLVSCRSIAPPALYFVVTAPQNYL